MKNKNKKKKQKAKARLSPAEAQATVPPVKPSPVPSVETALLHPLVDKWVAQAGRKFASADHESDSVAKRFIIHGAICYFNAACELQKILKNPNTQKLTKNYGPHQF